MIIKLIKPSPALAGYVKHFWSLENKAGDYTEILYPTGEMQLLFHSGTPFVDVTDKPSQQKHHIITGQNIKHSKVKACTNSNMIGVVFFPYSAAAFIRLPLNEITGLQLEVEDIFPEWKLLKERFFNTIKIDERIILIESFLAKRFCINKPENYNLVKNLTIDIIRNHGKGAVPDLLLKYGLSDKKAERLFSKFVGLSPKKYFDIARLQYAISRLYSNNSLTNISYEAGYYDQSHFNRKFKELTGITPTEFLSICPSPEQF